MRILKSCTNSTTDRFWRFGYEIQQVAFFELLQALNCRDVQCSSFVQKRHLLDFKMRVQVQFPKSYFFLLDPAPYTQFRDPGVRPAPRGASRASG